MSVEEPIEYLDSDPSGFVLLWGLGLVTFAMVCYWVVQKAQQSVFWKRVADHLGVGAKKDTAAIKRFRMSTIKRHTKDGLVLLLLFACCLQ